MTIRTDVIDRIEKLQGWADELEDKKVRLENEWSDTSFRGLLALNEHLERIDEELDPILDKIDALCGDLTEEEMAELYRRRPAPEPAKPDEDEVRF
jgi:hypothetical protein